MFRRFLSLFAIIAVALAGPADSLTGEALQRAFDKACVTETGSDDTTHAYLVALGMRGSNATPKPGQGDALWLTAYNTVNYLTQEQAQKEYINKVAELRPGLPETWFLMEED